MVVRAGIEVYRQKFLGAISTERNWFMSGIFLQRKLKIDGKQFLTGPRYQGGNINKPFIDIVGMDSDLNHTALELISKEWSQLRAQYVRILVPGQSFPQGIPDQYIYATSFSEPPEFNDKSLTLQVATYEDFDWCCQAWAMPISIHGRQFANYLQAIW